MRNVVLHGELAEKFGKDWRLAVSSPAEVIRAIDANCPGFSTYIIESSNRGVGYQLLLDTEPLPVEAVGAPFGQETLHIVPVIGGAGKGVLGVAMGAALIYFSAGTAGFAITPLWGATTVGSLAGNIGIGLVLGGVSQMLTPTPKTPDIAIGAASPEALNSYNFNGPTNNVAQGGAVPIGYGRAIVGSQQISLGITAEEIS